MKITIKLEENKAFKFILIIYLIMIITVAGCSNVLWTALHDEYPEVTIIDPADGVVDIALNSIISITFSKKMNSPSVSAQSADGVCSGSIQISLDDFVTCLGGDINSSLNPIFTFTLLSNMRSCYNYKIRVLNSVKDSSGNEMAATYIQGTGFVTLGNSSWTEYSGNPIFGGGTSGVDRAYYPAVVKAGSTYHIWYGDGSHTLHAASTYPDFHDISHPAPEVIGLAASYDTYHPKVLYNADGWTIAGIDYASPFLIYYVDSLPDWTVSPRVAHSADGDSWTDIGACSGVNSFGTDANIYNLSVLFEDVNTWKGYTDNGQGHIQYYTSNNGIDWTGQAPDDILNQDYLAWDAVEAEIAPFIMKDGSRYLLFYSSGVTVNNQAIGLAISTDGGTFTKSISNPIFSTGTEDGTSWRDIRSYTAAIIADGNGWLLYFSGVTNTPSTRYSIGYASKCGSLLTGE
jgi:Big-like domain-containing protein